MLLHLEAPLLQLAAPPMNGTVTLPPVPTPVPTTPVPVAVAVPVLSVKNGNPSGFEFGVIVVSPMTISGTSADASGAGVIVEDPTKVAVNVVKTSVRVVVRSGAVDVGLGAKVVDIAASATPEYVLVVDTVRADTCTRAVFT